MAFEVTDISAHETAPASASKYIAPIARLSIDVSPEPTSYLSAPFPTDNPPESVVVAVVEPMVIFPPPSTKKCVAVDEPMTNDGTPAPRPFGFIERSPHGVVLPTPRRPVEVKRPASDPSI